MGTIRLGDTLIVMGTIRLGDSDGDYQSFQVYMLGLYTSKLF